MSVDNESSIPNESDELELPVEAADPEQEAAESSGQVRPKRKVRRQNAALTVNIYSWATPVVGILMLVIGLLAGYFGRPLISGQAETASATASVDQASAPASVTLPPSTASAEELMTYLVSQVRHFKGDDEAPVTIIEFSDYKCPYCGRFAADSEPLINQNYIDEGLVRFGYWHVAFLGPESQWAAEAAECAAEQDAFWDYHALLFAKSNNQVTGGFSQDNLKSFAQELNLDSNQFEECVDSGRHTQTVQTDTSLAQQIGAGSTPAFLINGQPVVGAQPYEVFEQVIEQQLASQN